MSGSKFSTSRGRVIYVGDFLREFGPDALRYFIAVAGPETTDTDFTWEEFVRRTNFELANEWGNLVNRSISMAHKNNGAIPTPGTLLDDRHALLAARAAAFDTVGELLGRNRFKQAITEAMRVAGAANKYISDTEPWKLGGRPGAPRHRAAHRAAGGLRREHPADARSCRTPRRRCTRRWAAAASGRPQPEIREVSEEGGPDYPVIMGDYAAEQASWASRPIAARHAADQADPAVRQAGREAGRDRPLLVADQPLSGYQPRPPRQPARHGHNGPVQIRRLEIRQGTQEASVTPLELFFDLVFVFALTQVTAFMADETSGTACSAASLVMLLWWSWTGYAWVANVVSAEEAQIKLVMLAAMAAMFLMAL